MKAKKLKEQNTSGIVSYYNRAWSYMHAYAKRYRRAFYSIYTI